MRSIENIWKVILLVLAVFFAGVFSPSAWGADSVTLKDGTVVSGTIVRELDGNVWMKVMVGGIEGERFYASSEIKTIARDAAAPKVEAKAQSPAPAGAEAGAASPKVISHGGTPRAMVLTLGDEKHGDMVGVYMTAIAIERAIPMMEEELGNDGTGVLVLRFHSGGGLGLEVQKLSDVIHNKLKPKFRVVAWIDSAISAAAMTAHCIEEIYFTKQGNYGACTGFYGSLDKPVEGYQLEESLAQMEKISARGGYDYRIMRSMQIQDPLSATIDADGKVIYFSDGASGKIVVNREKEILTFNAQSAERVKFSRGTAESLEDLTKLMGYQELQWMGEKVKTVPWPVSKAEKMQMDYRKKVREDEDLGRAYFNQYEVARDAAVGANEQDCAKMVSRARTFLEKIKAMVRNNPNQALLIWGAKSEYEKWVEEQEKILRNACK